MLIRTLAVEDAVVLQECRLDGLRQSPDAFLATYAEVQATPIASVRAELRDPRIHYVGAFDGDRLSGFMRTVRAERMARRHTAEVRSVYVRPGSRGTGVASALLRRLMRDARDAGIESLTLTLLATNTAARALYEAAGFTVFGVEPRAVRKEHGDVDQLHMIRDLRTPQAARDGA